MGGAPAHEPTYHNTPTAASASPRFQWASQWISQRAPHKPPLYGKSPPRAKRRVGAGNVRSQENLAPDEHAQRPIQLAEIPAAAVVGEQDVRPVRHLKGRVGNLC
jgi:hypothetical protein